MGEKYTSKLLVGLIVLLIILHYREAFLYFDGGNVKKLEWRLLISAFVVLFFFVELLWKNILQPQWIKADSSLKVDMFFCLFVLTLLMLPVSRLNPAEENEMENRTLFKFPALWNENGRMNSSFGRNVETWLGDHITGRQGFLHTYNWLTNLFPNDRKETNKAFSGKEDWLFYIHPYDGNSLKLFQNRLLFTEIKLESIYQNLEQQNNWLSSHGIEYIVFIAPNKEDVYGEYYPNGIHKIAPKNRVESLIDYLNRKKGAVPVIYPINTLLAHKKDGLLYHKNGTHWSPLGAYYGYQALMIEICKMYPDLKVISLEDMDVVKKTHVQGGLNKMLPSVSLEPYQNIYYDTFVLKEKGYVEKEENPDQEEKHTPRIRTINANGKKRAIVFRDSFSRALIPYISESFNEVLYVWSHDIDKYADLIRKEQPDIVIHELVSRYASTLVNETPHWSE